MDESNNPQPSIARRLYGRRRRVDPQKEATGGDRVRDRLRGVRRDEHPRISTEIEVGHRVRGRRIDPTAVAQAIELSETKYWSVSAMLKASTTVTSRFEIEEDASK